MNFTENNKDNQNKGSNLQIDNNIFSNLVDLRTLNISSFSPIFSSGKKSNNSFLNNDVSNNNNWTLLGSHYFFKQMLDSNKQNSLSSKTQFKVKTTSSLLD